MSRLVLKAQVKVLNRALIEADLITMKDGPNGKRDSEECIIKAYRFDLSPLAARYEEFIRLALTLLTRAQVIESIGNCYMTTVSRN